MIYFLNSPTYEGKSSKQNSSKLKIQVLQKSSSFSNFNRLPAMIHEFSECFVLIFVLVGNKSKNLHRSIAAHLSHIKKVRIIPVKRKLVMQVLPTGTARLEISSCQLPWHKPLLCGGTRFAEGSCPGASQVKWLGKKRQQKLKLTIQSFYYIATANSNINRKL